MTELETIIDAMEIAERTLLECKSRIEELEKENETLKTGFMVLSGKVDNFRIYSYAEQELLSEVDDLIKGRIK